MPSDLGDAIRRARERKGWSQQTLADRIGVTLRSVGNWERGETTPRAALARVQDVLGPLMDDPATGLATYDDAELLAEVARRMAEGRGGVIAIGFKLSDARIHGAQDVHVIGARTGSADASVADQVDASSMEAFGEETVDDSPR